MVYVHGGAFVHGSGQDLYIEGKQYAKKGIILVTLNYRLGLLGFFGHPELTRLSPDAPTNFGLLDIICALKWVKKYVSFFGGNPDDITVFGESAGAASIQWLLASQEHRKSPLFTRAIMQSPPAAAYSQDLKEAEDQGEIFAEYAGCKPNSVVECLRNLTFPEMIALTWSRRTFALGVSPTPYSPSRMACPHVDYVNFLVHPIKLGIAGESSVVKSHDIIIGTTLHEWMLFLWLNHLFMFPSDEWMHNSVDLVFASEHFTKQNVTGLVPRLEQLYPRDAYKSGIDRVSAIYTDLTFLCPSKSYAKRLVEQGANVYFYVFAHEAVHANRMLQAFHSSELPFVFQKALPAFLGGLLKLFPTEFTPEELTLSDDIIDTWTTLGKQSQGGFQFGKSKNRTAWPAFGTGNIMEISVPPKLIPGHFQEAQCAFWDEIMPSPHNTIQFDLMAHEPFLLKAANGYTLVAGGILHAYGKFILGGLVALALVFVGRRRRRGTRGTRETQKSHQKKE